MFSNWDLHIYSYKIPICSYNIPVFYMLDFCIFVPPNQQNLSFLPISESCSSSQSAKLVLPPNQRNCFFLPISETCSSSQSAKLFPSSQSAKLCPSSQSAKLFPSSQSAKLFPSSQSAKLVPSSQSAKHGFRKCCNIIGAYRMTQDLGQQTV